MSKKAVRRKKAKGVKLKTSRGLPVMAVLRCADNSGAKKLRLIGVIGYKGRKGRLPSASVGDLVSVSVIDGKPDLVHTVQKAVIIRQKMPFRRPDGTVVSFEDNAAILVTAEVTPRGTEIKGPVAKEAVDRWPEISSICSIVV